MYNLLILSLILDLLDFAVGSAIPQVTTLPQKRDASVVTLNIGELSSYQKTLIGAPTPADTSFIIFPTDAKTIPSGGSHVRWGPELQKNLQDTKSECAVINDPKCLAAINKVWGNDHDDLAASAENNFLAARQGPVVIVASAFVALVGVIIAHFHDQHSKPVPADLYFPPQILSSLDSASTASELLFKTADNDAKPISVKVAATATGSGPLKTLAADRNGHHKGDIELDAPNEDVAQAINAFFMEANCQAKRSIELDVRADNDVQDCLRDGFTNILTAMGVNQPLHGLADTARQVAQNFPLPTFDNQQYAAAFTEMLVYGADEIPRVISGIAQARIVLTTTFLFMLTSANINHQLMEEGRIVLEQERFVKFQEDFKPTCPQTGDKHYPKCDSFVCKGKNGLCTVSPLKPCPCDSDKSDCPTDINDLPDCSKCNSNNRKCTTGDNKGCNCVEDRVAFFVNPMDPPNWADTLHQMFLTLDKTPSYSTKKPTTDPKCDLNLASDKLYTTVRQAPVWGKFCDAVDKNFKSKLIQIVDELGTVIPHKSKRTPPVEADPGSGYTFSLSWTGGDDSCPSGCNEAFGAMIDSPCGKLGGEQNNVAQWINYDTGCGTYKMTVNPPPGTMNKVPAPNIPAVPAPGPRVCRPWTDKPACFSPIDPKTVNQTLNNVRVQLPGKNGNKVDSSMSDISQTLKKGHGVTYLMNIHWIKGCTDYKTMVVDNPQGASGDAPQEPGHDGPTPGHSISCTDILWSAYKECTGNQGMGGYQDYGCLRYGFFPNWIKGVFGSPPNPGLYMKDSDGKGGGPVCN